jgi:integrase
MGVYPRKDSPFFWLRLERPKLPPVLEATKIRKDAPTKEQRVLNLQLAEELYHARMTELAQGHYQLNGTGPRSDALFRVFSQWYGDHVVPKHARSGQARELDILDTLRRYLGRYAVSEINKKVVSEFETKRLKEGVSASSVNRETDVLKAVLQAAIEAGLIAASPIYGMRRLRTKPVKRRLLTEREEDRLLAAMEDPVDQALFLIGSDGLVRLGDILDLQKDDDHGRHLYIREPKDPRQPEPYTVPISKRVRKLLTQIKRTTKKHFFEKHRGAENPRDWPTSVRKMLKKACAKAKVPYGRDHGGITFHWATRRTGATRMIAKNTDLKSVQRVGHWKDPRVVLQIYSEAIDSNVRRAVEVPGRRRKARKRAKRVT